MILYLLYESAAGYALFELREFDETNTSTSKIQKDINTFASFSRIVNLLVISLIQAFTPFGNADKALTNITQIADSKITEDLSSFLEANLPAGKKKKKLQYALAVQEKQLAGNLSALLEIEIITSEVTSELFRGIRLHFPVFLENQGDFSKIEFSEEHLVMAQLGLAHSFSRNRVQEDINRNDKHIIQSIALLEQLDKNVNLFSMRLKEWYSWHFPELARIVTDNYIYCKSVMAILDRSNASQENIETLEELVGNADVAQNIIEAANTSMGQEVSEFDLVRIK